MAFALVVVFVAASQHTFAGSPDLTVGRMEVLPANPTTANTIVLVVEIKNIGSTNNRPVTLFFEGTGNILSIFGIPMANSAEHGVGIPVIEPGKNKEFSFTRQKPVTPGNYSITAKIWPTKPGVVPPGPNMESNLTNNTKQLTFTITAGSPKAHIKKQLHKIPQAVEPVPQPKKIEPNM